MLYFESGDVNNGYHYQMLQNYPQATDNFLRLFFSGKINIIDALETLFAETRLADKNIYDKYMITLTLADEVPNPMTYQEVFPYFFALQVNYYNALGETDGRIENRYLAGRVGATCNWNFREYSGYNTLQNFEITYVTVKAQFNFLLNDIYLELPVVNIQKRSFKTKFKKANIGRMFSPVMESPGYFIIDNNHTLVKYKLPKSIYMEFFKDSQFKNGSFMFPMDADLENMINKNCHTAVQQMLYDNGFYSVCKFDVEDNDFGLNDDGILVVRAKEPPTIYPEESSANWNIYRDHIYGLIYKHKFYVTYLYGSEIYIMCN